MRHPIHSKFLAAFFVILGLAAAPAYAQTGQFYFGVAGGPTSYDTGIDAVTANLDESSSGYKLFAGMNINRNVAVEMVYADLGSATLSGNNGDLFIYQGVLYQFTVNNAEIKYDASLVGVAGVFSLPITPGLGIHARLGLASWSTDTTVRGVGVSAATNSDSGTDLYYGVGLGFEFVPTWVVSADFDHYELDTQSADAVSLGIAKHF